MSAKEIERRASRDNPDEYRETVRETTDSIEVTRSAKGGYHWSIKMYGYPEALDELMEKAERIDRKLRERFKGELSGPTGAE